MSAIVNFAKSGFWDYRNTLIPAIVAAPLALEGAILAKNIYQQPHVIKETWIAVKNKIHKSFTIQPNETRRDGILRIAKNTFISLACLGLMGTAAYGSFAILPAALAITTALSSIFLIGKLFLNANKYKKQLVEALTVQKGEDPAQAKQRIRKNLLKAAALSLLSCGAIAIGLHILLSMLSHGFSWAVSLPLQTKGVVFAEYASLGLIHGGLAWHKWKKGERFAALVHLVAAVMGFVFPSFYLHHDMRLHHSFYGLLLMATPFRPLQIFGGMVTLDSALYMLAPLRGYPTLNSWGENSFEQYDLINSIVDNHSLFAAGYSGGLMLENINKNWSKKRQNEIESPLSKERNYVSHPVKGT